MPSPRLTGTRDQNPNQKLIPSLPNGTLRALSSQQRRTDMKGSRWPIDVQRILRVNHSGEFGAIGIYQSQLFLARMVWPSGRDLLAEMLIDERRHLNVFAGMLAQRDIRPCHALLLWRIGGYALGITSALFGRTGILACTAGVESIVLGHLREQRAVLRNRDAELIAAIDSIEADEQSHHDHGQDGLLQRSTVGAGVFALSATLTRFAIWLSSRL